MKHLLHIENDTQAADHNTSRTPYCECGWMGITTGHRNGLEAEIKARAQFYSHLARLPVNREPNK
ncbi:hypothetical protein LCGC14_1379320 [marine sediment metagenome]|uniref:Uncharacterized protein n=1 Tax=marine sediment metagenome TaxID=412755 RepID=A0A0F9KP00_9ZZZZ